MTESVGKLYTFTEEEAKTTYHAAENYLGRLKEDMATKFGGAEEYSIEDDIFLGEQISRTAALMHNLEQKGLQL